MSTLGDNEDFVAEMEILYQRMSEHADKDHAGSSFVHAECPKCVQWVKDEIEVVKRYSGMTTQEVVAWLTHHMGSDGDGMAQKILDREVN